MIPAVTTEKYEVVIGIEVHAQVRTRSKMFCRCSADYSGAEPNTHVCPVCLGLPGVLPVINEQAAAATIMTGLALSCEIPERAKFDRKNYPYPDLMKGYQISEYDMPLCRNGHLDVEVEGQTRGAPRAPPPPHRPPRRRGRGPDAAHPRQPRPPGGGHGAAAPPHGRQRRRLLAAGRQPRRHAADGDRHGAGRALAGGGHRLPNEAAPDPALPGRERREHGGGQLPLRAAPQPAAARRERARRQG